MTASEVCAFNRCDHLKPIGSAQRSERYDRDFDDIFELQDEVARQVVDDALKIEYSERRVGA